MSKKRKAPASRNRKPAIIKAPAPMPPVELSGVASEVLAAMGVQEPQSSDSEPEVITVEVEEEKYQLEQETVNIEALLPTCPRCGSTERTPLKEISPRLYTDRGCIIRYRTKCRGRINPVDKEGNPVVDQEGKPVSYECGNRYKVKKLVPKVRKAAS